ncbi:unnamed protein product [Kuraishia capsulata CBS 1993]|uniref:Protein kinase domain-containing protein n=1 Tax=Kuraishia capsulata CBS 1993 TaxID=1382522 RepID=W6MTM1_9ASCO|nr:uncharacterized protein KUCA_T00005801001 [Kuraishia capsulata CBS 1993]CDK29808.1 unnamed protein product [Kuraishia capsulata CBS 1993]
MVRVFNGLPSLGAQKTTPEYLVQSVTNQQDGSTHPMVIQEHRKLGEGAFGTVMEASLSFTETREWLGPFAIKKVPAQTEYKSRELEILRNTNHPNVVGLKFFYNYPDKSDHDKLYQHLVMESLPCTLQTEIKLFYNAGYVLPTPHVQVYTFQIARAMNYLHSLGICHRDIKPSNILIDPASLILKICDFGSAKKLEPHQPSVSYICSRYYRAPELIVGCTIYTTQIDVWGLGCVLGEMLMGKPIFQGQDPLLQLKEISKLLGPPDRSFIFKSNPSYDGPMYQDRLFASDVPARYTKVFPKAAPEALDLLMRVLVYEPERRLRPRHVLVHPFFADMRQPGFKVTPSGNRPSIVVTPQLYNFSKFELQILGDDVSKILPYSLLK